MNEEYRRREARAIDVEGMIGCLIGAAGTASDTDGVRLEAELKLLHQRLEDDVRDPGANPGRAQLTHHIFGRIERILQHEIKIRLSPVEWFEKRCGVVCEGVRTISGRPVALARACRTATRIDLLRCVKLQSLDGQSP